MKTVICHRCKTTVITGLDDLVAALDVVIDPPSLSVYGEAMAVLFGRNTYTLDGVGRRYARRIWARHHGNIGRPEPWATVHAEHVCGQPIPTNWIAPEPPTPATHTEEPMF
jgi:hypothetical protein